MLRRHRARGASIRHLRAISRNAVGGQRDPEGKGLCILCDKPSELPQRDEPFDHWPSCLQGANMLEQLLRMLYGCSRR